jgi:O-succinylbenzoic acid--CoA ligase
VSSSTPLRAVPTDDRAWLLAALADALSDGPAVLPLAPGADPADVDEVLQLPLPAGTALVIRTSGSSGVPKSVAISAEALRAGAVATHEALGGPGQWLVALPVHLIAGAQMLIRSLVAGTDPVFCDGPDGRFDPEVFVQRAESMDAERRYASLVPVQLARVLDLAEQDRGAADTLRRFAAILVAHALGLELRRSYGMTETSGGCVYDGVEIGDTRVRIREGEVQIAGAVLAEGYLGDAALTDAAFIEDRGTRWYRTGDAGELLGGMLTVTGRLDRVVISGGINVSLDEVERVVREQDSSAPSPTAQMSRWGSRTSRSGCGANSASPPYRRGRPRSMRCRGSRMGSPTCSGCASGSRCSGTASASPLGTAEARPGRGTLEGGHRPVRRVPRSRDEMGRVREPVEVA